MPEAAKTIEFLLGYGAGVAMTAGVLWQFIITPLKKDRDEWKDESLRLSAEIKEKYRDDIVHLRALLSSKSGGDNA